MAATDLSKAARKGLKVGLANNNAGSELANILNVQGKNVADVVWTIGTESADAIIASAQLNDAQGNAIDNACALRVLIFADAAGAAFNANNYTIAAGTDGALKELVADAVLECVSETDGDLDISLTIAGAATCYLAAVLPGGKLSVSGVITHAA